MDSKRRLEVEVWEGEIFIFDWSMSLSESAAYIIDDAFHG